MIQRVQVSTSDRCFLLFYRLTARLLTSDFYSTFTCLLVFSVPQTLYYLLCNSWGEQSYLPYFVTCTHVEHEPLVWLTTGNISDRHCTISCAAGEFDLLQTPHTQTVSHSQYHVPITSVPWTNPDSLASLIREDVATKDIAHSEVVDSIKCFLLSWLNLSHRVLVCHTPPTCVHPKGSWGSQPHSGLLPRMDALLRQAFHHIFCYRWLPALHQLNFSSNAHPSNIADHIILTCTHSFILSFKPLLLHNSMALWVQVMNT